MGVVGATHEGGVQSLFVFEVLSESLVQDPSRTDGSSSHKQAQNVYSAKKEGRETITDAFSTARSVDEQQ
jgi:hypothetical protein